MLRAIRVMILVLLISLILNMFFQVVMFSVTTDIILTGFLILSDVILTNLEKKKK